MPYRLTLLGPWDLRGPDEEKVRSVLSQPKRLCLLAYLALSGEPVSRSTLVALFWPDSDEERARNALSQALHYLRRSLGPGVVESVEGDRIVVSSERVWFDARVLLREGAAGEPQAAPTDLDSIVEPVLRGREFFQGWNAEDSQPLQEWLDGVRRRVRERAVAVGERAVAVGEAEKAAVPPGVLKTAASGRMRHSGSGAAGARRLPRPVRPFRRLTWVVGGLVVGMILVLAVGRAGIGPAAAVTFDASSIASPSLASATDAPAVAVLLPRVAMVGDARPISEGALAQAIHEEMVAAFWGLPGLEVVPVGFESDVWRLLRSLEAQGADRVPDWVVSVGIRSGGGSARVVAQLRSGPDHGAIRHVITSDYPVSGVTDELIQLPRAIASDVVSELAEMLGGR